MLLACSRTWWNWKWQIIITILTTDLHEVKLTIQTVTKKLDNQKIVFLKNFSGKIQYYFFILVETTVEASKQTLFDVHRWSRSRDTDPFIKSSKNYLVQFSPLVCVLKAVTMNAQWGKIHGTGDQLIFQLLQTMACIWASKSPMNIK